MSRKIERCKCEQPEWMGGEEAWRKGKVNICQRCNGVTEAYVPPFPEPEPAPPEPLMKVFKGSRSVRRKVPPYRDAKGALQEDVVSVDNVDLIQVDELVEWCEANPDVRATDIAHQIKRGDFG